MIVKEKEFIFFQQLIFDKRTLYIHLIPKNCLYNS